LKRSAGLLLHITSLPGGRLGPEALRFVDFCAEAGQRWWQMLPVVPPGFGGSPYAALSAFAGSEELLDPGDERRGSFQAPWLADYALFRALKDMHRGAAWTRWPAGLRRRDRAALAEARHALRDEIAHYAGLQAVFMRQWRALRRHARARGVKLIGDLPLFVAHDSADVWAHQDEFKLYRNGMPSVVAGVPPDYFSREGQRWGNPHYRWDVMRRRRYRWWLARLARMFELFDVVRLDHFLGFHRVWEVSARAKTARRGTWVPGPGAHFLQRVHGRFIAEDLGLLTPEGAALRDRFRFPGMRVLQFHPDTEGYPKRCVAYTGTHDNAPIGKKHAWRAIESVHESPAALAIVPVQDVLGLGGEARMNTPGRQSGNWTWQLRRGQLRSTHAKRLRTVTKGAHR